MKMISYLSPNLFWFYQAVADSLSRQLNQKIDLSQATCDPLVDPMLQQNQVDLAFICGLPLLRHNRSAKQPLQLVVAPIMRSRRYQNQPIYFADVVVSSTSQIHTLQDLAGKSFCYNDRGSNSGYYLLRHRLIEKGYLPNFFENTKASGSHQRSLQWIIQGLADCAAIDSVVLEEEIRQYPQIAEKIRIIESIPSPIPPLVASANLDQEFIQKLQKILLQPDPILQTAMTKAQVHCYTRVTERDYQTIIQSYDSAIAVGDKW
jgi:phosphonate transport system substrate-binding protein